MIHSKSLLMLGTEGDQSNGKKVVGVYDKVSMQYWILGIAHDDDVRMDVNG